MRTPVGRTCLVVQPPRALRTFELGSEEAGEVEPRHPHGGRALAAALAEVGVEARFVTSELFVGRRSRRLLSALPRRLQPDVTALFAASRFDVLVCYATPGALVATLLRVLGPKRPRTVLLTLSRSNPRGRPSRVALRRLARWLGVRAADVNVASLAEVRDELATSTGRPVLYAPTGVDRRVFRPGHGVRPATLTGEEFVLVVGDSSRDDERVFAELAPLAVAVIRVTRDPAVVERLAALVPGPDPARGDQVLFRVSFPELCWLYEHAGAVVSLTRFDDWQAAGSSAITEAMAAGGACIVGGGGMTEREWRSLAAEADAPVGVAFADGRAAGALLRATHELLAQPAQAVELRRDGQRLAEAALDVERPLTVLCEAVLACRADR